MQIVHKSEHLGQSSVIFMPIIDMKSSDKSCILSTRHFATEQARCYNTSPILTFDQPLYWKGIEIQQSQDDAQGEEELIDFYDRGDHVHIWGVKFWKDEHIWGLTFWGLKKDIWGLRLTAS